MEAFVKGLRGQLEAELKKVRSDSNAVKGYDQCIQVALDLLVQLKDYVAKAVFPDKDAEIRFFKHEVSFFYSQYIYFVALHNAEVERITLDGDQFRRYLENERERINRFFDRYHRLHQYYHSGRQNHDQWYTRGHPGNKIDFIFCIADGHCRASYLTGKLLGYERYRKFINDELKDIGQDREMNVQMKLSKSEAVEFIMTLYENEVIFVDGKRATVEQVTGIFIRFFPFDLDDIRQVDGRNRMRIKDTNPLLHRWLDRYEKRIKRLG